MALLSQHSIDLDRHPSRHALLVAGSFSVLYLLLFSPLIVRGLPLAVHETLLFFWPAFFATRTPWTELLFAGFPLMGDPQTMMWYPLALIFSVFHAWNAYVLSAYVLASTFTYGYVYTLTRHKLAALISGVTYGMSGYFIVHLVHTNMIHAAAWLPLLIWSLEIQRRRTSRKWMAVTSIAVACAGLAGHPQIWAYTLGTAGLYALTMAWGCAAGWRSFLKSSLLGIVLGVGLTGVLLVPMIELAWHSVRAEITPQYAVTYSLTLDRLPLVLFPLLSTDLSFSSALRFPWLEVTGYVGFLSIALGALALIELRRNRIVLFWFAVAVIAVLFVLGASTPFGRLSFVIPVYNKFRAPGRHIVEFAFALSVLSGCGFAALREMTSQKRLRKVRNTLTGLAGLTLVTAVILARSESRGVIVLPCAILTMTALSLWSWSRNPSTARSLLLVGTVVLDLGHVGYFIIRPILLTDSTIPKQADRFVTLAQAAAGAQQRITALRATEQSLDFGPANLSQLWGVASAGGYDPLLLRRYSELAHISVNGRIFHDSLEAANRTLDLLAERYLLVPHNLLTGAWEFQRFGLGWRSDDLAIQLGSGCGGPTNPQSVSFTLPDIVTTTIGIASSLSCSSSLEDKSDVLKVIAIAKDGSSQTMLLKAGTDTSEWAWDRPDVRSSVHHSRATIFDSFSSVDIGGSGFEGHHYLSIVSMPATTRLRNLRLEWVGNAGMISLQHVSLADEATKRSYVVSREADALLDTDRWSASGTFGETAVFENKRAMPRAWLVPKVITLSGAAILETIHSSRLPNGSVYDPAVLALTETPVNLDSPSDPLRTATIQSTSETEVRIRTHSSGPSFLVLSNVYYPGWQATVDATPTSIFETDYVLRGVVVPEGDHIVVFRFRPVSLQVGLALSMLCALGVAIIGMRGLRGDAN